MKVRKMVFGAGALTAICAAALVAAFTLTPKSALATLKRSIKAVHEVRTAKVTTHWLEGGQEHVRTVWSDHDRTRDETDGHLSVYKAGKSSDDPESGMYIGRIEPSGWTLDHQLDIFNGALRPVDLGIRELNGRMLRLVRIDRPRLSGGIERWDYYLDDDTALPVEFIGYHQDGAGGWKRVWASTYAFNIALADSLFDLPSGKTWHVLPDQDVKPAEVIGD